MCTSFEHSNQYRSVYVRIQNRSPKALNSRLFRLCCDRRMESCGSTFSQLRRFIHHDLSEGLGSHTFNSSILARPGHKSSVFLMMPRLKYVFPDPVHRGVKANTAKTVIQKEGRKLFLLFVCVPGAASCKPVNEKSPVQNSHCRLGDAISVKPLRHSQPGFQTRRRIRSRSCLLRTFPDAAGQFPD